MRILIIDDDDASAESLGANLELSGYTVDVAPNCAAARACGREFGREYGLILLDLGLPDGDGVELLPVMKDLCPDVEIFVLTGNMSLDVAVKAVNRGATSYLLKPIEVPAVIRIVERAAADRERNQQIKFQTLVLESVQESVIAIDLNQDIIYWNHGAEVLYGWTAAEIMHQNIACVLSDDEQITSGVPLDGTGRVLELIRSNRDGRYVEVEERVHALRDSFGKQIGYLALSRDITERKEAERQRADMERQKLEREHQIAVTLQRALLPEVPSARPGLEIATLYVPAWAEADVGGDFYDVLPLPGNRTALLLGDVSGKGLAAGVLMSLIRHVISAYADEEGDPAQVLWRTNRHLAPRMPEERFVTLIYATYDPADCRLRYASAGHEPAILRRLDGTIDLLNATGPMVGLETEMTFDEQELSFSPGDLLLIYTDGASEAGSVGNFLGTEGLVELVRDMAHLPPTKLVEELHEAIRARCEGFAQDDLALLCLRAVSNSSSESSFSPAFNSL